MNTTMDIMPNGFVRGDEYLFGFKNSEMNISVSVNGEEFADAIKKLLFSGEDVLDDVIAQAIFSKLDAYYEKHEDVSESQMVAFKELFDKLMR